MNNRSLKNQRPMLTQLCCRRVFWQLLSMGLLLLCLLPRLTVHSHGTLSGGLAPADYAGHLHLFHASLDGPLPADELHFHWVIGCGSELLPPTQQVVATDAPTGQSPCAHFQQFCQPVVEPWSARQSWVVGSSAIVNGLLPPSSISDGITFSVWNC